ncbi:MAG: beta-phosphoglucomutase [Bacillota bacterium]
MKNKIEAIIFDLDGIVTDTAELHYKSWKIPLEDENIYFSKEENDNLRGLSRRDSIKAIAKIKNKNFSPKKEEMIMKRKNELYQKFINEIDKDYMIDGIYDLLLKLKEKKYNLAVASASRNAKLVIKSLGLEHFFKIIADGNSVKSSKPAPDIFLFVANKLGVKAENSIVIEDSEAGIEAAHKAGMKVVGVGPKERIAKADYCYKRVKDIQLEDILI